MFDQFPQVKHLFNRRIALFQERFDFALLLLFKAVAEAANEIFKLHPSDDLEFLRCFKPV